MYNLPLIRLYLICPTLNPTSTFSKYLQILAYMERVFFLNLSTIMESKFEEMEKRGLLHSGTLKSAKLTKEVVDDLDLGEGNLGGSADSDDEAADENKGRSKRQKREREDYGGEDEERVEMEGDEGEEEETTTAEGEKADEDDDDEEGKVGDDETTKITSNDLSIDDDDDDQSDGEPTAKKQKMSKKDGKSDKKREAASSNLKSKRVDRPGTWLKNKVEAVRLFAVDDSPSPKWCRCVIVANLNSPRLDLGEIVKAEVRRAVLHKVHGISRGFLVDDKKTGETWLRTEGINIEEFARNEQVGCCGSLGVEMLNVA